jgi:hypothetical protein
MTEFDIPWLQPETLPAITETLDESPFQLTAFDTGAAAYVPVVPEAHDVDVIAPPQRAAHSMPEASTPAVQPRLYLRIENIPAMAVEFGGVTMHFTAHRGGRPGTSLPAIGYDANPIFEQQVTEPNGHETVEGVRSETPGQGSLVWADRDAERTLTVTNVGNSAEDATPAYEDPPLTKAIADAVDRRDWTHVLQLAIQVGWHDQARLTNLLFFSRHPELGHRRLDPKQNKQDRALADEWNQILVAEVKPAIQNAAQDTALQVAGTVVTERDSQFSGENGAKFTKLVVWAANEVNIDPGFLAAVLLAEVGSADHYLSSGEVSSFFTGTDSFLAQSAQLRANVPAFTQVHFDETKTVTNINEHGNEVTSVFFRTGRDAALATAVYLKWGEIKVIRGARKHGGDFEALSIPTRFVLTRIAMAAGHGGISLDGDWVWFKRIGDKVVEARAGEPGAFLVGVAPSLFRVLNGQDILVRNWEPHGDPAHDSHIAHRNATILAAQAIHFDDWFFRPLKLGVQP